MTGRPRYVIFAELEGTAREQRFDSRRSSELAVNALQARGIPLVISGSGTRAEIEVVASQLGIRQPFIVENGGAILIPEGYFPFPIDASRRQGSYDVIRLGLPYLTVVAGLRRAAEASGCSVRGFGDMPAAEIANLYGLNLQEAARAKQREYDEPFMVLVEGSTSVSALLDRIEKEGLTWTRGRRFYHIRGRHNKGQAAQILSDQYRRLYGEIITVGVGNSPNDLSLLEQVDVPIMLQSEEQEWSTAILELLNRSARATGGTA